MKVVCIKEDTKSDTPDKNFVYKKDLSLLRVGHIYTVVRVIHNKFYMLAEITYSPEGWPTSFHKNLFVPVEECNSETYKKESNSVYALSTVLATVCRCGGLCACVFSLRLRRKFKEAYCC
jgi:hypothetical protein